MFFRQNEDVAYECTNYRTFFRTPDTEKPVPGRLRGHDECVVALRNLAQLYKTMEIDIVIFYISKKDTNLHFWHNGQAVFSS